MNEALTKYNDSINLDINRNGVLGGKYSANTFNDSNTMKNRFRTYSISQCGRGRNSQRENYNPGNFKPHRDNGYRQNMKVNQMSSNKHNDSPRNERVHNMNRVNNRKQERYFITLYAFFLPFGNRFAPLTFF